MKYVVVLTALLVGACNSGGTNTPTAPTPPPVVIAPPPPPAPTITNYAGRWFGQYTVEQCSGSSGSMGDVLCSAPRGNNPGGIFQVGQTYSLILDLSQNGGAVNGSLDLGQIVGPVSGSVLSDQSLVLAGAVVFSDAAFGFTATHTITQWQTFLSGGSLTGTFSMSVKVNIFPGDGVVRVRLSNVRR